MRSGSSFPIKLFEINLRERMTQLASERFHGTSINLGQNRER